MQAASSLQPPGVVWDIQYALCTDANRRETMPKHYISLLVLSQLHFTSRMVTIVGERERFN